MKVRYIFCIMCLMLLTMPGEAGLRRFVKRGKTNLPPKVERMIHKRTLEAAKVRPVTVESVRAFGIEVLNAIRTSVGLPSLPQVKELKLAKTGWQNVLRDMDVNRWSVPLVERYGEGRFNGFIIQDLSLIDALTGLPEELGHTAKEALQSGVERAKWTKDGYFVVTIKGSENRLKDIVVMDHDNQRWISLNKSKGSAIARDYVEFSKQALKEREAASYPIEQQGMWIEYVDNPGDAMLIRITEDGLVWRNLNGDRGIGADIEQAWSENYYIRYYPHEHKALYSEGKDYPFFSSVEEIRVSNLAFEEGLEVEAVDYHPVIKFSEGMLPNVLIQTQEGLRPVAGQAVTADVYSQRDVIDLVKDLRKVSENVANIDPAKKIIYKRPATGGNYKYQSGQIEQYLSY